MLKRYANNPILAPADVPPTRDDYEVIGVFNAGAARVGDEIVLLLRVAERPVQNDPSRIRIPVVDTTARPPRMLELSWSLDDPDLDASDPRGVRYKDRDYLTSVSHLRVARSRDGYHFTVDPEPALFPITPYETYGLEDPRITPLGGGEYGITYVAVSNWGIVTAVATTQDFVRFERKGVIFHPENKNSVLFPEPSENGWMALHRPAAGGLGDKMVWFSRSPDGLHWGGHRPLMGLRPGMWDSIRIGAGAPPIKTHKGWLEIYHGVDDRGTYHLGAVLLDLADPTKVLGRSPQPILSPGERYETDGFFGQVVFTCGAVDMPDGRVLVYYGCADERMAVAEGTIGDILDSLEATSE